MIIVDCSELSGDEKLALAAQISDAMDGEAIALVKGDEIVLDELSASKPDPSVVRSTVAEFISGRKEGAHYSMEVDGERIVVHSAEPVAPSSKRVQRTLPPNVLQCPFCAFITEYQELLTVHTRAHLFGA